MSVGGWLRDVAEHLIGRVAMDRIVEPTLTDLTTEYCEARRGGRTWRARLVIAQGYLALAAALLSYASERVFRDFRESSPGERRTLVRAAGFGLVGASVLSVLLTWPYVTMLVSSGFASTIALYALPSALPLAIPFGLMFGIFCAMRAGVGVRLRTMIVLLALAGCVASFVAGGWLIPRSNQAFRVAVAERPLPLRFVRELTLGELRQAKPVEEGKGWWPSQDGRRLEYHRRLALAGTALAFTMLALAIVSAWARPVILLLAGFMSTVVWYSLWSAGGFLARYDMLSAFAGAWLPNAVLVMLIIAIRRRQGPSSALATDS